MSVDPAYILADLTANYRREEFPVLLSQLEEWSVTKPLQGVRIIDGAPVFFNTCAKYAALLAAGAELTVAFSHTMPHDPAMPRRLDSYAIPYVWAENTAAEYDVVMDCAGALAHLKSRYGYVELTRSGVQHYARCQQPVLMVDAGKIKQIETCLGTGESFFRALEAAHHQIAQGQHLVVIGGGKVGRGIVLHAVNRGLRVTVADISRLTLPCPGVEFIHIRENPEAFNRALEHCDYAVTATGVLHALYGIVDARRLIPCPTLLANMGVEDEWGPDIPKSRILNAGAPLNFTLPDPTLMCFIDPPLALHNQGAVELVNKRVGMGICPPSAEIEEHFLNIIRSRGIIPEHLLNYLQ